jgi:hypothetical protein
MNKQTQSTNKMYLDSKKYHLELIQINIKF